MESFNQRRDSLLSYSFICYNCGDLYAKVEDSFTQKWGPIRGVCAKCPPESIFWNWLPGSVMLEWEDKPYHEGLSDEVVQREFELHLNWYEKELRNEKSDNQSNVSDLN